MRWLLLMTALSLAAIGACGRFSADEATGAPDATDGSDGSTSACIGRQAYCRTPPCTPEAFTTTGPIGGFAVHAGWVYRTAGADVLRQPVDGGVESRVVVATGQSSAGPIVADADGVFWFDRDAGIVRRCPLTGACVPALAGTGPTSAGTERIAMGTDRDNVYWTVFGGGSGDGGVFAAAKRGAERLTVSTQPYAKYVVGDGVNVYWLTNCQGAFSRKKDLSGAEVPLPGFTACTSGQGGLALAGTALFAGGNELVRLPLGKGALARIAIRDNVGALTTDCANAVYWTQTIDGRAALVTLPESAFLDGGVDIGARVTLANDVTPTQIVADSTGLYFPGTDGILRLVSAP